MKDKAYKLLEFKKTIAIIKTNPMRKQFLHIFDVTRFQVDTFETDEASEIILRAKINSLILNKCNFYCITSDYANYEESFITEGLNVVFLCSLSKFKKNT